MMQRGRPECPRCGRRDRVIKCGWDRPGVREWKCKGCGRRFVSQGRDRELDAMEWKVKEKAQAYMKAIKTRVRGRDELDELLREIDAELKRLFPNTYHILREHGFALHMFFRMQAFPKSDKYERERLKALLQALKEVKHV